ncbi:MAG: GvpL/GvpF family gas vesicle protein [Desulfitobacteriaceae bacterium]
MVWSPEEWQRRLEDLVEQCAEQVLRDLEKEVLEQLKTAGQKGIKDILSSARVVKLKSPSVENLSADSSSPEDAWYAYAYALVNAGEENLPPVRGMEGSSLTIVREGKLGMFISPVPAMEFSEAALHRHLEDLAWVETHARQHEEALLKLMEVVPLVPLPFCTVFTDRESIKRQLREKSEELYEVLKKLGNHCEMTLKLLIDHQRLEEKIKEKMPYLGGQTGGGYFQKRQWEKQIKGESERFVDTYGESLLGELKQITEEVRLLNSGEVSQSQGLSPVFIAHFLLHKERQKEWEQRLEEFDNGADRWGFVLDISGPWPPYHFTGLQGGEEASGGDSGNETSHTLGSGGKVIG